MQHRTLLFTSSHQLLVLCVRRYSPGGAASGFSHVEHKIKPRLMHVKGKNYPRISEVPIGWSSMNEGDAYILDIGEVFFVWNGKACSRTERIKVSVFASLSVIFVVLVG